MKNYLLHYAFDDGSTVTYYFNYLYGPRGAITNLQLSCEQYGITLPNRKPGDKFIRVTGPGVIIDFETISDMHFHYLFEPLQMT